MSQLRKIVMDCGGDTIKVGIAGSQEPMIIPNVIAKSKASKEKASFFVGDQIETECENYNKIVFRRPFQMGYLVDFDAEYEIWTRIFGPILKIQEQGGFANHILYLSEPPFTPNTLKNDIDQIVFEYFGFNALNVSSGAYWNLLGYMHENLQSSIAKTFSAVIVDSGFSFTHVIPIVNGVRRFEGIRRINVGGKVLTNYLKEIVSYRYYNMMDETYLMNVIKERMCYTSLDFMREMQKTRQTNCAAKTYVLPDYNTTKLGYVKDPNEPPKPDEQVLTLNNERIVIPEILFHPSDIGMDQGGIAEATVQSIQSLPIEEQELLFDNILLVGGNTKFPNFKERFYNEVRTMTPSDINVTVHAPKNPITTCWKGGSFFALQPMNHKFLVTKQEYLEKGHDACRMKFIL